MLTVKYILDHPTIKIDLSDHPFIKEDICEAKVKFSQRGNRIGIINYYCEHHNITYIPQSNRNIPWNRALHSRQRTNFWILSIWIKETTTVKQVMEVVSSQQLTVKFNKVHVIIARIYKGMLKTNPK